MKRLSIVALQILCGLMAVPALAADEEARLNELLIKGSHNSYHQRPLIALHPRHRYQHDSLYAQLDHHGVRAMEFDLHLSRSGEYEVYHIAFIDDRSHCKAFVLCLQQVRAWSDAHRDHEPLLIWIEIKDYAGGRWIRDLQAVDELIRDVLGDRLMTPDDVQGAHGSLRAALAIDGWPTLAESRGRILLMMTGDEDHIESYTSGLEHLRGRAMFADATPDQFEMAWAAVTKLSVPDGPALERARRAGLLVSTTVCVAQMSDSECFRDRDRALAAGANVLLDDYVRPVPHRDYFLDLDVSHVARVESGKRATAIEPSPLAESSGDAVVD